MRVDDSSDPLTELGRLADLAVVNDLLNPKLAHQARVDKDLDPIRARVDAELPPPR